MNEFSNLTALSRLPGVTGAAKVCAIIGDPVAHSLSPPMHNAAFRSLAMDLVYVPFRVRRGGLSGAIQGIRALGILGVNVTMPHKTSVMRYLDMIDGTARTIGAVNTIVRTSDGLRGYNTDGKAALEVLQGLGGSLSGRRALILGAGGAARAVLYYISKTVESIAILNRTRSKGSRLATQIAKWSGAKCRSYGLKRANLRKEASQADLLINTLPVDVFPRFGRTLIEEELIVPDAIVFDLNYNPRSNFLAKAKLTGAKVTDGLDMLIGQAALSFKLWTGRDAPVEVMREAADEARGMRGK